MSKDYTKKTGVEIEVILLRYGPEWHDRIAAEFAAKGDGFDMAAWDSQSVAEFASGGHIELLNSYIKGSSKLSFDDFLPTALKHYGEYPAGSGQIWAIPINQDTVGLIYRKDLFEDPTEKANFQKKYGYPLGVPRTCKELMEVAEFFTRPEKGLYGWGQFSSIEYDLATSTSNGFLWSYGGELWNPKTNEVKGFLDSPASVDGLKQYLKMFNYAPPESRLWGYLEVNNYFRQGKLAMGFQWYTFFEAMANPKKSPYADKTGFANLPGAVGRDGMFRRQISMGGQGLGINTYSKKKKQAWAFIEWFMQREQQWLYSTMGQTGRKDILVDPRWQTLNKYNRHFHEAMTHVNDYWHLPEYYKLLEVLQQEVANAIYGKKTAKEALMDAAVKALMDAAVKHEAILLQAGYKIRRSESPPEVPDTIVDPVGQELPAGTHLGGRRR
ncbi:MAG: sugar ABC transporter substrate-binding protein [Deltaproteobacteria bacterium]|nr:sugar ABC transporter substrate-binding protein [Deltaproteobacteria bacterium]